MQAQSLVDKYFYPLRYISIIAVISSFIGSSLMFLIGASKTIKAFISYFLASTYGGGSGSLKAADLATSHLIRSIDAFLIGLVLMIFSYGVYNLFIRKVFVKETGVLSWVKISSIAHLKNILAEVIIVILFVKFLEVILLNLDKLSWELLILPVSILLLALSLKFLGLTEH